MGRPLVLDRPMTSGERSARRVDAAKKDEQKYKDLKDDWAHRSQTYRDKKKKKELEQPPSLKEIEDRKIKEKLRKREWRRKQKQAKLDRLRGVPEPEPCVDIAQPPPPPPPGAQTNKRSKRLPKTNPKKVKELQLPVSIYLVF